MSNNTHPSTRNSPRNSLRNLAYITLFCLIFFVTAGSCSKGNHPSEPPELPPYRVDDWTDGGTHSGETDQGRPMTHEDSLRFGLI